MSIGDGGSAKKLIQEVQKIDALLLLASQESVLQGKEIGLAFEGQQYRFYVWQNQQWQLLQQDDVFHPRFLPTDIQVKLRIEGEPVDTDNAVCETTGCKPQLVLFSSGEWSAFELTFKLAGQPLTYQIKSTLTGTKILSPNALAI